MRRVIVKKANIVMLFFLAFAMRPAFSEAVEVKGLEIIEYGIYKARIKTEIEDPDAPKGEISTLTEIDLSERTDKIPAVLGNRLGMRYVVEGSPKGEEITVKVKYSYPELTDPKSKRSFSGNEFVRRLRIGTPYYNDYAFEEDWELVPGTWVIQIYYMGKKLGGKKFEIYRPKVR